MNRTQRVAYLPLIAFSFCLFTNTGCRMSQPSSGKNVISAADLTSRSDASTLFLDVRPRADYEVGHVSGARWVDLTEWVKLAKTEADGLEHFRKWQQRIATLGVGPDSIVRVYDDGSMIEASRLWFILQHFCVAQASVVNGGWRALQREMTADRIASGPPALVSAYSGAWPERTCGAVDVQTRADVRRCMTAKEAKILDV
ncbi:MAG: hypothetical protein JNG88_18085, partial [Phycisphaerales bacterium]|nr:hypothetical protein [Phycisphaerales bacterium]